MNTINGISSRARWKNVQYRNRWKMTDRPHITDRIAVWVTYGAASYFFIHIVVAIASALIPAQ